MPTDANLTLRTGLAALLLASVFLAGWRLQALRDRFHHPRSLASFAGGMASAYVFVHVIPELHSARSAFVESIPVPLRFDGMGIYYLSMFGFLVFYGLEHLRRRLREERAEGGAGIAFRVHLSGFAAYVWLVAYLLVHNLEKTPTSVVLYTIAMSVHFIALDRSLHEEHGAAYQRTGRLVLAGMCLLGWGVAMLVPFPPAVIALLVAVVSGSVIVNSLIMELPTEKDGRFVPFMLGGILYGLILLPLS